MKSPSAGQFRYFLFLVLALGLLGHLALGTAMAGEDAQIEVVSRIFRTFVFCQSSIR